MGLRLLQSPGPDGGHIAGPRLRGKFLCSPGRLVYGETGYDRTMHRYNVTHLRESHCCIAEATISAATFVRRILPPLRRRYESIYVHSGVATLTENTLAKRQPSTPTECCVGGSSECSRLCLISGT